jgi:hypothetical protein
MAAGPASEAYFKFLDEAMAPLLKEGVNKVWEDTPEDPMVRNDELVAMLFC